MSQNRDLNVRLEAFFDKIDKRLESMENKLDSRLSIVEVQCSKLEKKSVRQERNQAKVNQELHKLQISVAVLEQEKVVNNVIIKGVPEVANEDDDSTGDLVDSIFNHLNAEFESKYLVRVRRIGKKNDGNKSRLIVAELVDSAQKLAIMKNLAGKDINCSLFKQVNGTEWGPSTDKIFLTDHLTPTMANIFYHARQLRKQKKIKYAWTKLGHIYVKKDDVSLAYNIKSMEQLNTFEHKIISESKTGGACGESESESDMDQESEAASEATSKKSTDSKRARSRSSYRKVTERSPRPKRHNSRR